MRVTTQMMHTSAKRAGISLGGASLLKYINKENTQTAHNALLNALNTKSNVTVNKTQATNYKKLDESANSLLESLEMFMSEGKNGIFQQEDVDQPVLKDAVKQLVKKYNDTIKTLKNTSNPLNDFYREMLKEAIEESEAGLASIGIAADESGMLTLEKDKLENADAQTLKNALDGNSLFTSKTAYIVSRIVDNAKANTESYSCQYGADGYSYVANSNRYDFWG